MTATLDGPRAPARSGTADALVVLLHGYGADGNDLFGLAGPLSQILPNAAFVSPNAPERCQAAPFGRQWFPIPWIDGSSEAAMTAGFDAAAAALDGFLAAELASCGVAAERLALVGFSQGAMMSLEVGLRRAAAPAAIVGFSGRLGRPERLEAEIAARPPVLLTHGARDEVIPADALEEARSALAALDVPVRWALSPNAGHEINQEMFERAAAFLREHLQ